MQPEDIVKALQDRGWHAKVLKQSQLPQQVHGLFALVDSHNGVIR